MAEKEYIERKDLINNRPPQRNPDQIGKEEYNNGYNDGIKAVLSCIEIQPSADVEPVRYGEWANEETAVTCTACGRSYDTDFEIKRNVILSFNYCPNCGARMAGKEVE